MNIITTTALSNFKKNKSRNILIGIAIVLTAFLLTLIPTVGMGMIEFQSTAVNEIFPTYHGMYRDVKESTAEKLLKDEEFDMAGLREDPAYMYCENSDVVIAMVAVDDNTVKLSKTELAEGEFPKKASEIVVSPKLMESMGFEGGLGDRITVPFQMLTKEGLGMLKEKEFVICGIVSDSENAVRNGIYTSIVSDAFVKEILPEGEHTYRVYFRLKNTDQADVEVLETRMKDIGESYGIKEKDIVYNSEYLWSNYTDPETFKAGIVILLVIVLTGMLTIYSIYYVSMLDKVQEYGRLRAIGATKRQIRKLVFREGFAVAAIAVPVGILAGILVSLLLIRGMIYLDINTEPLLAEQMRSLYERHEVHAVKLWIIGLALFVSLFTVYCALLRPMRIAGSISPIEAIRYRGKEKQHKKKRRGCESISTGKLTAVNLGRNKKRTAITIVTLGATGILFMMAATVISCMNPQFMAEEEIRSTARVELDSWEGDEMHPERELLQIQKNNPLNEELKKYILQIDGVEKLDVVSRMNTGIREKGITEEDGRPLQTEIIGLGGEVMNELEKYVVEGSVRDRSLTDGTGIILQESVMIMWPELEGIHSGDYISLELYDGDQTEEKEFKVAAVTDAPRSLGGYCFSMPDETLRSFSERELSYQFDIFVEQGKETAAEEELRQLISEEEFLTMDTYKEQYEMAEMSVGMIMYGSYGILLILGLIGILNLINTMTNSVYIRRKELGMLQAVGMSERQTINMLQLEGLFYTAGTLAVSLGIGSAAGYLVFLWAEKAGILDIKTYTYPVVPAVVLILAVLVTQILVTYLVSKSFKKQSLIERIRFS